MVDDEEALRCGLNKDKSRVAEQAASTDEEEKRELVWKNGSKSKFFFARRRLKTPHGRGEAVSSSG